MVKHVTSSELEELIAKGEPVFCDFWAVWCGPCRMLGPVFEELSEQYDGKASFVKVDVDSEEEAARKIMSHRMATAGTAFWQQWLISMAPIIVPLQCCVVATIHSLLCGQ